MDSLRISGFSSPHVANVSRNAVGNTISRATDTNDFPKPPLDIMEQSATEPQARIGEMTISACLSDGRVEQVNFMEMLHRCANSSTVMNGILQEPG
ncbi:MAG: hypothetical protein LBS87_01830, partial [Puniceicoccales bacterium]|nr:hypothetical protein [Puniceicoccales bacterium]